MVKAATDSVAWRGVAVGAVALIIGMLGWFLVYQVHKTDQIEQDVNVIQTDIALIKQRLGVGGDGR